MADPEYFTLAELRALPDMDNVTRYPEARCLASAAHITAIIERVCGTSFISRTVTAEVHNGGCTEIFLKRPYVLSVTSATENGSAVTDTLRATTSGILRRYTSSTTWIPRAWLPGFGNVTVTYAAGYSSTVPGDIKEAAILATRDHLLATASAAETARRQNKVSESPQPPSADRPTGFAESDAIINGWRDRVAVPVVC